MTIWRLKRRFGFYRVGMMATDFGASRVASLLDTLQPIQGGLTQLRYPES